MDILQILDSGFNQVGILPNWTKLIWADAWNSESSFELTLDCDARNAGLLQEGMILYAGAEMAGIINYVNPIKGGQNNSLTASGYALKDIARKRVTVPPAGQAYDVYSNAYPDQIVRSLVLKHIISPVDAKRAIPGFSFATAAGIGTQMDFSTRYKSLQEELCEVLKASELALRCALNLQTKSAQFYIAQGTDRTIDQDTNPRAMFSLANGSLSLLNQIVDAGTYKNMLYVGGQGEGTSREIVTIGAASEGWGRDELFVDARDVDNTDELYARGYAKMAESGRMLSLTGDVAGAYKGVYANGDYVSVFNDFDSAWYNVQITAVKDTYTSGEPSAREITLGQAPASADDVIKYKFAQINNLLTR